MPLVLTEEQRRALSNRLMAQAPPAGHQALDPAKIIDGLPQDVLVTLEAMLLLAEQGNRVARWLYEGECQKFGISRPRHFIV